jgi:hypothetical protein
MTRTTLFAMVAACSLLAMARADVDKRIPQVRVSPEGAFCSLGCYDVSPESPDGTKILYMQWTALPTSSAGGNGAVWYCNRDLTGRMKIIDLRNVRIHNGGSFAWLDNQRIQVYGVWDEKKKQRGSAIVNLNGTVEHGPYLGMDVLHAPFNGQVLLSCETDGTEHGRGVFVLDTATGAVRKICDARSFLGYTAKMPDMRDPTHWRLSHPTWSRDGTLIAVCLENDSTPFGEYLFSFRPDFTDVVFFGKKPVHFNWYDDHDTIYGSDKAVQDGRPHDNSIRRWTRDGKWVEDLAGSPATHCAMSPDKLWFAGETYYDADPILYLFRKGMPERTEIIMSHTSRKVTWNMRAHVNPTFSRDGKRLYYNRATSETLNEVWYADLSGL